jgi:hypothetical protein
MQGVEPIITKESHLAIQFPGSLLDWFAGQATDTDVESQQEYERVVMGVPYGPRYSRSECKYRHAAAMIQERERREQAAKEASRE